MRFIKIALAIIVGSISLLSGCDSKDTQRERPVSDIITVLSDKNKPIKKWINPEAVIVRIPGQDGVLYPTKHVSKLPDTINYLGIDKVIPGISMLKRSVNEKLSNEAQIKSKKPVIIQYSGPKKRKIISIADKQPITKKLLPKLILEFASLKNSKRFAVDNNLIAITNGDTIYPPISLQVESPKVTKALPLYYKENARFDISGLEANQELPNSWIRSIAMDDKDIMWFLTHTRGLISYDGNFFSDYIDPRRLTGHTGNSMIIDSKGNIWVGTKGGGVFCFDGYYNTQYTVDQGLISNIVVSIAEDREGNIWCGTTGGLCKITDSTTTSYTIEQGLPHNYVYSLYEDRDSNIWIGTMGGGVSKINGKEFLTYNENDGLCHDRVLSILQDNKGNYWFGTFGGGVSKFDGKTFTNYTIDQGLESNVILSIIEDETNNIWFGTYGDGITSYDGKTFTNYTTDEGLGSDYIRTMTYDNKGNIWIGTDGAGVSKININGFSSHNTNSGLSDDNVGSVFQDDKGRLFFATFEGGISVFAEPKYPGQLEQFFEITTENGLAHNIVVAMVQDQDKNYWFGTFGAGVSKLDADSFEKRQLKFTNYSDTSGLNSNIVRSICVDNQNNIWFATEGGATKFDGDKFTTLTTKNGLASNVVVTIHQDQKDNIWFGTMDGGVSCLSGDTIITYTTDQGLAGNTVWTISEDKNGYLWFGTEKHGLSGFNGNTFRTISDISGLTTNDVYSAIIDDKENLWIGTIKGLNKIKLPYEDFFNPAKVDITRPEISNFGRSDGLLGLDFSSNSVYLDNMNCIWWGTDKALTMLDLSRFKLYANPPIPNIYRIGINGENINYDELLTENQDNSSNGIIFDSIPPFRNIPIGLSLAHDMNYLTFVFSATDWSSQSQIQYQYKIEGFDKNWSLPSKENTADYRNLPPGKYVFKLRAIGISDSWSDSLEYPFVIRRPWYRTYWAALMYVIFMVFFVWLLIRWRVNIVQRQKSVLAGMVNERTKELDKALVLSEQAAEAKNQFIATISHELRTPLNAILGLSHLALNNTVDPNQEDYLNKIDRSANTLLSLINEILDFSKIEAGKMVLENVDFDLDMVINSIIELNAQYAKEKNIEFVINVSPDIPKLMIGDPLRIGQIITNLCNNSIKFTSNGELVVSIELQEKINSKEAYLQIKVKDSGIGISEDQLQTLFDEFSQADASTTRKYGGTGLGLSICKLFIEMMDGQIWIESEIGKGTTIFFDIKVGIQHANSKFDRVVPEELKKYSALVCMSNKEARDSLYNILKHYSIKVDSAKSGKEVISMFASKQYDLLIIDIDLEGLSGLDTIFSINTNDELNSPKTILITDSITDRESVEQNITGIDGYLLKPLLASNVINKILTVSGFEKLGSHKIMHTNTQIAKVKDKLKGKKVLVAEDNELNQQVVIELVKRAGISVDCVENGAMAIQKASDTRYDLILMDLHMPVKDGFNATIELRKKGIDIPIVAITADAMGSVVGKCKEAGIVDIITKPINPAVLYQKLIYWLLGEDNIETHDKFGSDIIVVNPERVSTKELDILKGIKRLGNDKNLYYKMLRKFINSSNETIEKLSQFIEKKALKEAQLVAHSLKGESGNLGAVKVAEIASIIDGKIKEKDFESIDKDILDLRNSVSNMSSILIEIPEYNEDGLMGNVIRPINQVISEMIEYLQKRDPKIFDLLDELENRGLNESALHDLNKAVNADEVENAISILKKLT